MPLPASVVLIPVVSGYVYRDASGSVPEGKRVVFIARTASVVVDDETVTLPKKLSALIAADGSLEADFELPTTGEGVYYDVVEDFPGGRDRFTILVLTTDVVINLATVAPAAPAADATPETVQAMAASAAGSAASASTSASEAATSATTAGTHAASAATSATAAAASATTASNAATAAGTSETNAADSATDASTSAGQAATSATEAATSATAASGSATAAAGSASAASTSAGEAATSATAAASSATAAAGSATTAGTHATNAGTSATAAATSADAASTSAGNAATSATAASGSADAAAQSATDAAALIAGTSLLRHGSGAPLDTLGNDGDYYLDDDLPKTLYGPKAAGAWPSGVSLKGETGDTGATGATGRIPVVQTVASAATVTPTFADDMVKVTAQAEALALANPTGTPVPALGMVIRIKDNGTARAITYGTQYRRVGVALPATTVVGKTTYLSMIYNSDDTKWDVVAVGTEA